MTQQQQIALLSSIMPEINDTHDPKGVMLKCAKKHNLSPAQLEKLGHVYNTAKTLVGLEKQAHRGDSFSIVDVPEMVSEYTSFDPSKAVAKDSGDIHRSVNRLMKYASAYENQGYWTRKFNEVANQGQEKAASAKELPSVLDSLLFEHKDSDFKDEGDGNQNIEIDLSGIKYGDRITKSASASTNYVDDQLKKLASDSRDAMVTASMNARDAVEEVRGKLLRSYDRDTTWREMAEDIDDHFGDLAKSAAICHYIESHLEYDHKLKVKPVTLEKRAGRRSLERDRHGVFHAADELDICAAMFKEAKELYEAVTEQSKEEEVTEKQASALVSAMQAPMAAPMQVGRDTKELAEYLFADKDPAARKQLIDKAKSDAAGRAALQQLMLSDPIISTADPYEVEDIYNTISSLNSTIAQDPVLLGPVLKESLQYKSVPIQMLKDMVSVDKDRQQAVKYKKENESLKHD